MPRTPTVRHLAAWITLACLMVAIPPSAAADEGEQAPGLTTWDGRHSIDTIRATVVYFLPSDRQPLPDWRERVEIGRAHV